MLPRRKVAVLCALCFPFLLRPSTSWAGGDSHANAAHSWVQRAQAQGAAGHISAEIASFRVAKRLDPGDLFILLNLADAYRSAGDFSQCRSVLTAGLRHFHDPDDRALISQSLADEEYSEGVALAAASRHTLAADSLRAALAFDSRARPANAAADLEALANLAAAQGAVDAAEGYFRRARNARHALNDPSGEVSDLNQIGLLRTQDGRPEDALLAFDAALPLAVNAKDRTSEASLLNNRGLVYEQVDRYELAIADFNHALRIAERSSDTRREAAALANAGANLHALGQYAEAIVRDREALALTHGEDAAPRRAKILSNLGYSEFYLGQYASAERDLTESLDLHRQSRDVFGQEVALGNLGWVAHARGQLPRAGQLEIEALALAGQARDPVGQGICLLELGRIAISAKKPSVAVDYLNRAAIILKRADAQAALAKTYEALMQAEDAQRQTGSAVFWGKCAVDRYQAIRGRIQDLDDSLQSSFLRSHAETYRTLAALLIAQGRLPEAQQALDLLKQEEFYTYARAGRFSVRPPVRGGRFSVRPPVRGGRFSVRPPSRNGHGLSFAVADVYGAEPVGMTRWEQVLASRLERAESPADLARMFRGTPAAGAQEAIPAGSVARRSLSPGVASIYTVVGSDGCRVILTTRTDQIAAVSRVSAARLNTEVYRLRDALQNVAADPRPEALRMYRMLIPPSIANALVQIHPSTVLWSLDGALRYIPMAALYDGRRYLVERWQNVVIDSAAPDRPDSAPLTRGLGLGVSLAHVVTDPVMHAQTVFDPLPSVPSELHDVIRSGDSPAGVVPGRILLDGAFSAPALREALDGSDDLVHIASHFELAPGDDENSYLLLGDGSPLRMAEIEAMPHLFRGVNVLTLSACNTAVGGGDGKEIDALGVVARREGAASVIATLWPVEDPSTEALMHAFYTARTTPHVSSAAALRTAQMALLHGSDPSGQSGAAPYAHPYFWAGFVLVGGG